MIFAYNPAYVGDTLLIITDDDKGLLQEVTRKGKVARIQTEDKRTVGWNIFGISQLMALQDVGQVELTEKQIGLLNQTLQEAGFTETLPTKVQPKFVIGYVKTCEAHKDSDHLSITEVEVDQEETLQIVCGAPNIREGLKVVVAKPGAMMPDGTMIWPGELRGVESFGMICSAKELQLPDAPEKRGILELSEDAVVGKAFFGE
ncbi:YtpR family tRNA-binding protein [Tetragenococcus koreensis]|uniref:YtpR family tRNA-binding protein n=1 Tax=Tetragenococcus koreensis TaxID=290335 RepID=UPI001F296648|nr:DUF4479 and tRNA-binding domain-containing protein [Tetragenococcus koreensis]MDN6507961.1 DUF4479 and tRNA-binding domain-containing protein [Tetragenococcus halophilus]MCF1618333.1 DUF4479 and tRNA-binding domain-containing protein [Tetragenococcus koreensis]MCF1623121.1 DUF4479 and tRNA-binding domain-containing protein [Tetragenococcus koreensis]MCF1679141.1 DUF4479 and tRNA-binding domain-containing protein [Tetragenococcus koreensis]MCF1681532.1 DUF4479 and tRNA-binding domain-contain